MDNWLPHHLIESANTLPASMEVAHVDVWTKINDDCFISPAIDRLNSLEDKGYFDRREKAFDDQRELVDHFTPVMTSTPFARSLSPAEAQPAVISSPNVTASQPHDPVVEKIEEILGVVGVHKTILGEQVAGTISLLEKAMAHVHQLHKQSLIDIIDATQGLRKLRHDLTRAKPPYISPHQDEVVPDNAENNLLSSTRVEPTCMSHEGGRTGVGPVPRGIQEHNENLDSSISTVLLDNKRAEHERSGEAAYDNSCGPRPCKSCGFVAQAQHQPRTQPSVHRDETLPSPIDIMSSTGSDGQHPPSAEQEHPDVNHAKKKQQRPVQQHSEHVKGKHDKHTAASVFKATYEKNSNSTSPMMTTRPVKSCKPWDTAVPVTSSAEKSSSDDMRLFTPVLSLSGGMQPYVPECAITESVRSSENTSQSISRTGMPLLEVQISTLDKETASIQQAPEIEESDVLATKGVKRRLDNTTDARRKHARQRIS